MAGLAHRSVGYQHVADMTLPEPLKISSMCTGGNFICSAIPGRSKRLGVSYHRPLVYRPDLSDDPKPRWKPCFRFHPVRLWAFLRSHCSPAISSDSTPFNRQHGLLRQLVWPDAFPFSGFPSSLSPPLYYLLYCFLFIAALLSFSRCWCKKTKGFGWVASCWITSNQISTAESDMTM